MAVGAQQVVTAPVEWASAAMAEQGRRQVEALHP
jgi:hypothetical protein